MKNIYQSKNTGILYARSNRDGYIWRSFYSVYSSVGNTWRLIGVNDVSASVFRKQNIYKGEIEAPPDWKVSMKNKMLELF